MSEFILKPSISESEKNFREKIGQSKWDELKIKFFAKSNGYCYSCGYIPEDKDELAFHVEKWDGVDPDTTELFLICKGCHAIKHFDSCVKNNWIVLCNSSMSQEELVRLCRDRNKLTKVFNERKIILISKTPEKYLEEIRDIDYDKKLDKVKVVFRKEFSWK